MTGPGGSGKTRLAVETARTLLGQASDGVWLVELAALTDAAELELAARFDVMVLLRIDLVTMLARLDDPARGNDFGRVGHSRDYLIGGFERWQAHQQRHADVVVDATADLDTVTRQVAKAAARPG